ncbi:mitochondrial tRNA-specific 2-thiouridylase 1 [Caerostris extrusa]|uniref:tRNA-5-taurinomethyluridine 2-sulfurtransferase n=1 Tax=Caerostris extrusa TaxID=172846 RepID=A0AAV4Y2I3_CAEEX|nr:mitochondrial tRNA-specific 2-thiouridylase 1 [Caerostris extrusa]
MAAAAGLDRIVKKKESVGICFIGKRNFQDFIDDYIEVKKGNFINVVDNKIVGQHKGVHCWTVGQRCAIAGQPVAFYVAERNVATQDILVAPGRMHPALFHQTLVTEAPYWINEPPVNFEKGESFQCEFRFQHREPLVNCLMYQDNKGRLQVYLEKPLRALTPGQYAVFYTGDECLGSARILFRGPSIDATCWLLWKVDRVESNTFPTSSSWVRRLAKELLPGIVWDVVTNVGSKGRAIKYMNVLHFWIRISQRSMKKRDSILDRGSVWTN